MSSAVVPIRKALPAVIVLSNLILALIAIVNLARGYANGSYISASYFLCITSIMNVVFLSIISLVNTTQPGWMSYALLFELTYICVFLVLQFVSATVVTSDQLTAVCRAGDYSSSGHNICPSHQATLAFSWIAVLCLVTHLTLLLIEVSQIAKETHQSARSVLTTTVAELLDQMEGIFGSGDLEKSLPRAPSPGSEGSGRSRHRPPPLNLSAVGNSSLPGFNAAIPQKEPVYKPEPKLERPNRHQLMAAIAQDQEKGLKVRPSDVSLSDWAAPVEWAVESDKPEPEPAQGGFIPMMRRLTTRKPRPASKQLPSLPPNAMTYSSKVGGVINRPDPRDRRPPGLREVAAEGGFWLSRTEAIGDRI